MLERKNMEKQARWAADEALVPEPCLRNFGNQQETKLLHSILAHLISSSSRVTWAHTGELKGKVQACQIKFCRLARRVRPPKAARVVCSSVAGVLKNMSNS